MASIKIVGKPAFLDKHFASTVLWSPPRLPFSEALCKRFPTQTIGDFDVFVDCVLVFVGYW